MFSFQRTHVSPQSQGDNYDANVRVFCMCAAVFNVHNTLGGAASAAT